LIFSNATTGCQKKRTFELNKTTLCRENELRRRSNGTVPNENQQNKLLRIKKGGFEVDNPYDVLQRLQDCCNPAELTEWRRAYQPATAKIRRTKNRSPPKKRV
jgi:hypothetical protein